MKVARVYWRGLGPGAPAGGSLMPGSFRRRVNYNWDSIDRDSTVYISASEFTPWAASPGASPRVVGEAMIRIDDIAPHGPPDDPNRGVTFAIVTDWDEPLNIYTDIVVLAEKPEIVQEQPDPSIVVSPYPYRPPNNAGQNPNAGSAQQPQPCDLEEAHTTGIYHPHFSYTCDVAEDHIEVTVDGECFPINADVLITPGMDGGVFSGDDGYAHSCFELMSSPVVQGARTNDAGQFHAKFVVAVLGCTPPCQMIVGVTCYPVPDANITTTSPGCGCAST